MSKSELAGVKIRRAVMSDVLDIQSIVNYYAKDGIMLSKSLNQLYENLRDFLVLEKENKVVGCGALHFFWSDLAEVRSLAIEPEYAKSGYGSLIVDALVKQAGDYEVERVFCFTLAPKFFSRLGFIEVPHGELPQKVYKDCINCVKLGKCDEIAMVRKS